MTAHVQTPTARLWTDQRGCGPDVVLLAGLGEDAFTWRPLIDRLSRTRRVTLVDHRGAGRSDLPPRPWRVAHFVDDIIAVLDHYGIQRAHIVGTCLGAVTAQELAAAHPERVDTLVLNGTWRGSDPQFQALLSSWIWTAQHAQTLRELQQVLALTTSTAQRWEAGAVAKELEGAIRLHGVGFFAYRRGFNTAARALRSYDAQDRLASITAPALLTVGALDAVRPPVHTREVADQIPGSQVRVIAGAGRRPFAEDPEGYGDVLEDWLPAAAAQDQVAA